MATTIDNNEEDSPLLTEHTNPTTDEQDTSQAPPNKMDTRLILKIAAAMYSFITLGLFNSSIGAVLPLLSHHYNLTELQVSCIFLAGPIGYIFAAQCSDTIHFRFGQRGIAVIGPIFQIIATSIAAAHPSFGLVLVAFAFQGLGTGLLDGSWCAWAGSMEKANTISGLLHGSYSIGGALGPFLVGFLSEKNYQWYMWYSILTGTSFLSLILLTTTFRAESASVYQSSKSSPLLEQQKINTKDVFKYRATWLCAAYFIAYVGTETTISGWIVSYMLDYRHSSISQASICASGFWIGMAVGRVCLGFVTDRVGVRSAVVGYLLIGVGIEVMFFVFKDWVVNTGFITFLGFVMGPLFPSGVVVLTRLLPAELHVQAVSFVASLGQVGAAVLPFGIGAVVQSLGIGVFRLAVLVETVLALGVWVCFARLRAVGLPVSRARFED